MCSCQSKQIPVTIPSKRPGIFIVLRGIHDVVRNSIQVLECINLLGEIIAVDHFSIVHGLVIIIPWFVDIYPIDIWSWKIGRLSPGLAFVIPDLGLVMGC